MATVLEGVLSKSIVVLYVLVGRKTQRKEYLQKIFLVYGGKCLLRKSVHIWVQKFSQGRSKVADDARPGRLVEIATEATIQWVEELIRADRRITVGSVATALRRSHGLAYSIIHGRLKFREA
jgi:transposase